MQSSQSIAPAIAKSSNGFAGHPVLEGIVPFICLTVTVEGPIDPDTGMLVNIKVIDAVVRESAVERLRTRASRSPLSLGALVLELFPILSEKLLPHQVHRIELAPSPYLRIAAIMKESPMVRLSQRFEFSAAHRLHSESLSDAQNRETFGRCNNPNGHGHNYELEVTVVGSPDPRTGVIMSVGDLQRLVNEHAVEVFDHKHLNLDCPDFEKLNPTVENIARVLFQRLKPHLSGPSARLASVKLWETPKTMCEYSE